MKKALVVIMAMVIFAGCGLSNDKTETKETTHIHGVEVQRDGYEIDGVFCPKVEKLHFYGDETETEVEVQTAEEYCSEHGYFEVVYNPKTLKVIELHGMDDGSLCWYSSQLRPVNWTAEWRA